MPLRFPPPARAHYRAALLRQGKKIADQLAEILSGARQPRNIAPLGMTGDGQRPGMRPEERLRAYLDLIEARRRLIDSDDDRFGRCDQCGIDLGAAALDEMPWANTCQRCAAELAHPPAGSR